MLGKVSTLISRLQEGNVEKRTRASSLLSFASDVHVYARRATTTLALAFTETLGVGTLTMRQRVVRVLVHSRRFWFGDRRIFTRDLRSPRSVPFSISGS